MEEPARAYVVDANLLVLASDEEHTAGRAERERLREKRSCFEEEFRAVLVYAEDTRRPVKLRSADDEPSAGRDDVHRRNLRTALAPCLRGNQEARGRGILLTVSNLVHKDRVVRAAERYDSVQNRAGRRNSFLATIKHSHFTTI